jgi:hypothetical protein
MKLPSFPDILPDPVLAMLQRRITAEFATLTARGEPIDTPTFFFPDDALTTLDIGTGLAYPAKAERARRNPKVGMLVEGGPGEPVMSIAGMAAVQDSDIQANLDRYLAETILAPNVDPARVPWEKTRRRLYYLARIIVRVAPVHIRWWPCREAMDEAPQEWVAPASATFPQSDPAPSAKAAPAPVWRQPDWPELADQAIAGGMAAHVTLCDGAGFPAPLRAAAVARTAGGFRMTVPLSAPWQEGAASLSFAGKEIFVGQARRHGGTLDLVVERCLPVLPMMDDRVGMAPEVLAKLDARLEHELARRGLPMPVVAETPPQPTMGARLRAQALLAIDPAVVGAGQGK